MYFPTNLKVQIIIAFLLVSSVKIAWTRPDVVRIFPTAQSMIPFDELTIGVEFDEPVDPASFNEHSFMVFGRWTGVCPGKFTFENNNQLVRFLPSIQISAGEWLTVSLAKSIKGSNGENMASGYAWNFWTASAPGSLDLLKVKNIPVRKPIENHIRAYGAYAGDLNGDGFHDFTVPNEDASDVRVFLNDGKGNYSNFTTYNLPSGSSPSTNEGADFNFDGIIDFACGNIDAGTISVFIGDGAGGFNEPVDYAAAGGVRGLTVLDLDGDGDTDIVTANREGQNITRFLNNGDGTFQAARPQDTGADKETTCASGDFNEDGIIDIAVGTYSNGYNGNPFGEIVILLGDGNGGLYVSARRNAKGNSWMLALGDMDNDGHLDVVSANSHQNNFVLLRGDGRGELSDAETYSAGGFPIAIDVGDLDGDGDLDLVTSNFSSADWTLYENDGTGKFINSRRFITSGAGSCAVLHDRDRDGDLDMTGIDELDDLLVLFSNPAKPTGITTAGVVETFALFQSYPNPFALAASAQYSLLTIPFSLNKTGPVRIDLFDIRGRKVATVVQARYGTGENSVNFTPLQFNLPAGLYFYRMKFGNNVQTKKLVLLNRSRNQ